MAPHSATAADVGSVVIVVADVATRPVVLTEILCLYLSPASVSSITLSPCRLVRAYILARQIFAGISPRVTMTTSPPAALTSATRVLPAPPGGKSSTRTRTFLHLRFFALSRDRTPRSLIAPTEAARCRRADRRGPTNPGRRDIISGNARYFNWRALCSLH